MTKPGLRLVCRGIRFVARLIVEAANVLVCPMRRAADGVGGRKSVASCFSCGRWVAVMLTFDAQVSRTLEKEM